MPFIVVTLDEARRALSAGRARFEQRYPGLFLLAIGRLRAQPVDPDLDQPIGDKATREYAALDLSTTLKMSFGERLTHAMQDHPLAGCTFLLPFRQPEPQTVGRNVGCDLTVPDASVSDRHCEVQLAEGSQGLRVTDLGSTNGTSLDLHPLPAGEPAELRDEAILTVGRYAFQLLLAPTLLRALHELDGAPAS